jgi:CheY-like chemotaxis protein
MWHFSAKPCLKAAASLVQDAIERRGAHRAAHIAAAASIRHRHMTETSKHAPRVLIIENDFLIGEMLHDMAAELGYAVTKVAHRLPSALREISKENFDGALVNIGIDEQKRGTDIADILLNRNIPFGFVTGYGHALEQRHAHVPLLQKPFNREQLRELLEVIVGPGRSPNHNASHAA